MEVGEEFILPFSIYGMSQSVTCRYGDMSVVLDQTFQDADLRNVDACLGINVFWYLQLIFLFALEFGKSGHALPQAR